MTSKRIVCTARRARRSARSCPSASVLGALSAGGRPEVDGPNKVWAMDFMADQLFDGRLFRILTVVDCGTREVLASAPRGSFRAYQVVEVLDQLARERGRPKSLRVNNGPEFAGRM